MQNYQETAADIWDVTIRIEGLGIDRNQAFRYAMEMARLHTRTPGAPPFREYAQEIITASAMFGRVGESRSMPLEQAIAVAELRATG